MPGQFLTIAERDQYDRFPKEILEQDLHTFFTLSSEDRTHLPVRSTPVNRLGYALQMGVFRYLGFFPTTLTSVTGEVVTYVARQLQISPTMITDYGKREHTRTDHQQRILDYLGFRKVTPDDIDQLHTWLVDRALEHDRPTTLLQLASEWLYDKHLVRFGITQMERLVMAARQVAIQETFALLSPILTAESKKRLDLLLVPDPKTGQTPLFWLRQGATTCSPGAILDTLDKLAYLKQWRVPAWDLSMLNPNRLKHPAQIGRRSTNQILQRMVTERRYPILVAFLHQAFIELTDEAIDLFDRRLAESYARSRHDLEDFRHKVARATNEKIHLFRHLTQMVLDPTISDTALRKTIYQHMSPDSLRTALDEATRILRPLDDSYVDFLERRYPYLRVLTPFVRKYALSVKDCE